MQADTAVSSTVHEKLAQIFQYVRKKRTVFGTHSALPSHKGVQSETAIHCHSTSSSSVAVSRNQTESSRVSPLPAACQPQCTPPSLQNNVRTLSAETFHIQPAAFPENHSTSFLHQPFFLPRQSPEVPPPELQGFVFCCPHTGQTCESLLLLKRVGALHSPCPSLPATPVLPGRVRERFWNVLWNIPGLLLWTARPRYAKTSRPLRFC